MMSIYLEFHAILSLEEILLGWLEANNITIIVVEDPKVCRQLHRSK